MENEVAHFRSVLWSQRWYNVHVVVLGSLHSDTTGAELCLHLAEPGFRVHGPEWRELEIHCCHGPWRLLHQLYRFSRCQMYH